MGAAREKLVGSLVVVVEIVVGVRVRADEILETDVLPVCQAHIAVTEQVRPIGATVTWYNTTYTTVTT